MQIRPNPQNLTLAGQIWPTNSLYTPENILIKNNLPHIFMTISLVIKMGLFPFFVYTLNVNQGISWNAIFFIGVISKLPIIIIMVNYGNIISPQVMVISGLLSTLISGFIIFNSIYVKRYIASSSLASMGWLSIIIGVYKNNSNIFFYNLPLSTIIWGFWVIYGVNTLLIVIMLENCYPLIFVLI